MATDKQYPIQCTVCGQWEGCCEHTSPPMADTPATIAARLREVSDYAARYQVDASLHRAAADAIEAALARAEAAEDALTECCGWFARADDDDYLNGEGRPIGENGWTDGEEIFARARALLPELGGANG